MAVALEWGRPLTYDDLQAMPDDGRRHELVDGVLIVTPSPVTKHQRAVARLIVLLSAASDKGHEVLPAPFDYVVMRGYWDNPEATAEAIDAAGWMHTGDLGVMDADGYLNIVGRSKDMVIRGGENVYPREIEEVLFEHPAVAGAQVIGVPDERMGEELMAWIQLREGADLSEDDVRDFCRAKLAHFKVPRYVKFTGDFPMTVTGKVQKFRLRELAIAELDLGAAAAIKTA